MQIMDRMTDTVIFVTVSLKSHTHTRTHARTHARMHARTHLFNSPLSGTRGLYPGEPVPETAER